MTPLLLRANYRALRIAWSLGERLARRTTPAGLLAIGVLVLAAAAGVDTEASLSYQVFTFTLALLLVAAAGALWLRRGVSIERRLPALATAGEPMRYRLVAKNDGRRARAGLEVCEQVADPRPGFAEFSAGVEGRARWSSLAASRRWQSMVRERIPDGVDALALPRLRPGETAAIEARMTPRRRGRIDLRGVWLSRREPLGLLRAMRRLERPASVLVLPRRYAVPEVRLPGKRVYQHGGVTLASSIGDSEEFLGLREYRPGDPLQNIHWKSFARTGRPIVKEYQTEFFERHALVLDTFAAREDEVLEEAVSVAASFACTLDTQESLLDLLFVADRSYCYTAGRGQMQPEGLLEVLAHLRACPEPSLEALERSVLERRARLSGCILVLLAWDDRRRGLVDALRASGLPLLVLVVVARGARAEVDAPGVHALEAGRVEADLAGLAADLAPGGR